MKLVKNFFTILLDFTETLLVSAGIFALIYFFVGQPLEVSGESMFPTLQDHEQIIAEKISLKNKGVNRGDIVIFKHPLNPTRLLVKRVVAMPKDKLEIEEGGLFINDSRTEESYLGSDTSTLGGYKLRESIEYTVPENSYVLMGDNREGSSDSRDFGFVDEELIVGKAFVVYYPFSHLRKLD